MNKQFRKDGFLIKKNLFSTSEIQEVLDAARKVFGSHIYDSDIDSGMFGLFRSSLSVFSNCGRVCQHNIPLHRMGTSDLIMSVLKESTGIKDPVISTRPVLFFNNKNLATEEVYYKTPPHQDWRSIQGSLNSVVVWIPLVNVTDELGPLEVIPGSHKRGLCAKKMVKGFGVCDAKNKEFVKVEMNVGDALFFSTYLIHRSGNNITEDKIRWSCHFRYNDLEDETYIGRGYPSPYVYYPEEELITPGHPSNEMIKKYYSD